MEFKHVPVLLNECIEGLAIKQNGIYLDGTLGGGGHSLAIVSKLEKGRLVAIDRDEEAISAAKARLKEFENKITYVHDDFKNAVNVLDEIGIDRLDGVLLDLGVSSYQLDNAERGFSYMKDAPLDMRMDRSAGASAYDLVNNLSAEELTKILYEYGEEKLAPRIAQRIVTARANGTINTTAELSKIVENAYPTATRWKFGHPAKRTFQAIRIAVNGELMNLGECVEGLAKRLNVGGRIAIITFHSLEDRIIKNAFRKLSTGCTCPPDFPICVCGNKEIVKTLTKKPLTASESELKENPRAESAKLRIVEKI